MAIKSVKKKGASNRSLAKLYGVDESTIRYHVKRDGKEDGRKNKPTKAVKFAPSRPQYRSIPSTLSEHSDQQIGVNRPVLA